MLLLFNKSESLECAKVVVLCLPFKKGQEDTIINIFVGIFIKTMFPLTLVGYRMIIPNLALCTSMAIYHLIQHALITQRKKGFLFIYLFHCCCAAGSQDLK